MSKKAIANALAFVRTGYETGNVRNHEFSIVHANDAQVGVDRRERIVCNLGPRVRCRRKESGLPGIRQPQQPNIGDQLQAQPDLFLQTLLPWIGATWRLVG